MDRSNDELQAAAQLSTAALVAFRVVADELHFGRAGARLRIDQSQVSRLVQQFEQQVGQQVFERTTRSVRLTDAGRQLVDRVDTALAALVAVSTLARSEGMST